MDEQTESNHKSSHVMRQGVGVSFATAEKAKSDSQMR